VPSVENEIAKSVHLDRNVGWNPKSVHSIKMAWASAGVSSSGARSDSRFASASPCEFAATCRTCAEGRLRDDNIGGPLDR
jgi:hypothetical protein